MARRYWLLLATAVVVLTIGTAVWTLHQLGYRAYVVHTGSMEPRLMPGDLVLDKPSDGEFYRGEIITFRHSDLTTDVVTHRVTRVTRAGLIHTKGDANATPDVWEIRPDQVRGTVTHRIAGAGFVIVFFQQPAGIATLATAFLTVVLLWQLFFPSEPAPTSAAEPVERRGRHRRRPDERLETDDESRPRPYPVVPSLA